MWWQHQKELGRVSRFCVARPFFFVARWVGPGGACSTAKQPLGNACIDGWLVIIITHMALRSTPHSPLPAHPEAENLADSSSLLY